MTLSRAYRSSGGVISAGSPRAPSGPPARAGVGRTGMEQLLRQTRESAHAHGMPAINLGNPIQGCHRFGKDLKKFLDRSQEVEYKHSSAGPENRR